jgi:hypothetical protein
VALNRLLSAALVAGLLAGSAWLGQDAAANFAASPGFSGRAGPTCLACHTEAPVGHEEAAAALDGLPAEWEPGKTYRLTIRVEGGPAAMPAPAPQGGFDLSIDGGSFAVPAGFEGKERVPNPQEITYLPDGTLMREWQADWTAPGLESRPATHGAWLAVLAANGNHVVAANTSDGGERFDSVASLTATVPPAPSALEAWRALPLLAPEASVTVDADGAAQVSGRHLDGNATSLSWSLDGGAWQLRPTGAEWRLRLEGLSPGSHRLAYRSEGSDRVSPEATLDLAVPGSALGLAHGRDAPLPSVLPLIALVAAVLLVRRSRP